MTETSALTKIEASRSIYYSLTDEVPGLTEEEKEKLEAVMKKAQEFEAEEICRQRQPTEGQLYKYTNVMKGWQYRWFVLTPDTGMLEYYMVEEKKKNRPRGALHLVGAVVTLSDEDKLSFSVSGVCGEVFKLKASDSQERQFWVDKIKFVIDKCSKEDPSASFAFCKSGSTFHVTAETASPPAIRPTSIKNSGDMPVTKLESPLDSLIQIKESIAKASECQKIFAKSVESLPFSGPSLKCTDRRLLLIKATSQATVQSIEECYLILRKYRQRGVLTPTVA